MVPINVSHLLRDEGYREEMPEEGTRAVVPLYHVTVPAWLVDDGTLTERAAAQPTGRSVR